MKKILIVDDSPFIRMMVKRALLQADVPADGLIEAGDGQQALDKCKSDSIGAIILDLNMPVMDGETFLRRVRAEMPTFAPIVVIVSTEANHQRILSLRGLGIRGFLHKPFEPEKLKELLAEHLDRVAAETKAKAAGEANVPSIDPARLDEVVLQALERMAFILADRCEAPVDEGALRRRIGFAGPDVEGELVIAASEGLAREAAAGMTGMEDAQFDEESLCKVLDELANIIGGEVIVLLGGRERPFKLGLPGPMEGEIKPLRCTRRYSSLGEKVEIGVALRAAG
jgi:two-component system chemotaxis response regulator CheY